MNPKMVIVSMIEDDLKRSEFNMRSRVYKPYYEMDKGNLILKNRPVPILTTPDMWQNKLRHFLGYSYLIHKVMWNINKKYWVSGVDMQQQVHHQGEIVACSLLTLFKEKMERK